MGLGSGLWIGVVVVEKSRDKYGAGDGVTGEGKGYMDRARHMH